MKLVIVVLARTYIGLIEEQERIGTVRCLNSSQELLE